MILQKPPVWEKSAFLGIAENAFLQSHCRILLSSILLEGISLFLCLRFFCMEIITQLRQLLRLLLLTSCRQVCLSSKLIVDIKKREHMRLPPLVGFGLFCLLSNQIAGLFDHQNLQKLLIDFLDFCMEIASYSKEGSI